MTEVPYVTSSSDVLNVTGENKSMDDAEVTSLSSMTMLVTDSQRLAAGEVLQLVKYVFLALSLPVTVCNVFVFMQPRMRSATSVYILGLSFAQILFMCAHVGKILWTSFASSPRQSYFFCLYTIYAIDFCSVIARRGSYVILCFVSVERLYAVMRPLHVKNFILSKFSAAVMIGTFAVTAIWHVIVPAKETVEMVEEEEGVGGGKVCRTAVTQLYVRDQAASDAVSLALKVLMTYVALLMQIALNLLTVWALRRHNAAAKHVQPSSNEAVRRRRERQLTVTILATTVAYVVLSLPACLNGLLNIVLPHFNQQGGRYGNLAYVVYHVCLDLQILSCSVDFVCFFALSSNYRRTFFRVFPCLSSLTLRPKGSESSDSEQTLQASVETSE